MLRPDELDRLKPIEPVYPLTAGLAPRVVQRAVAAAARTGSRAARMDRPGLCARRLWPAWAEAVRRAHAPAEPKPICRPPTRRASASPMTRCSPASSRWHWSVHAAVVRRAGRSSGTGALTGQVEAGLGFALTGAQRLAIAEIAADMAQPRRMMRLLQGDVGSGKTVVALLAMLSAVESGGQAALMAPTEILARQHHATLQRHAAAAEVEIGFLTGREKGRARASMLASLASGLTPIVVGTHALLQPDVEFRDLALVVIDEQHRFGVEQRLALSAKGRDADTLLMSADADPAHPDDDRLWRSRRLAADRKAAGTAAGRHPDRGSGAPRRGRRGSREGIGAKGQGLLDLPDGRGIGDRRPRRRRGAPSGAGATAFPAGSAWCTAA